MRRVVAGVLSLLAIALASCAVSPERKALDTRLVQRVSKAFADEAPDMLCEQRNWQVCSSRTRAQCVSDLQPFRNDCMAQANLMAGTLDNAEAGKKHSQVYFQCLAERHMDAAPGGRAEFERCVQSNPFDTKLITERTRAVTKPYVEEHRKEVEALRKKKSANP
ncbi:hypothetical protein [Viridibacterium curvum]|uniref:Lipoprotein n=1 Tax=Viridibacterium curvum TaxID=1101404 RepID=A0ABP9QT71_9RHOO